MAGYGDLSFHRSLIGDKRRSHAYRQAILDVVHEGDVVLDIGTGSGLLACFACQAGAQRVYAVEQTEIINVAKQLAQDNGFADRIVFLEKDVRHIDLPEQVDVIVSELISKAVIGQNMEVLTALYWDRYLRPTDDGATACRSAIAPVELVEQYAELDFPSYEEYQLDFSSARKLNHNLPQHIRAEATLLAKSPNRLYGSGCRNLRSSTHPNVRLKFTISEPGTMHGYCAWFEATLCDTVRLSNHPPGLLAWDNLVYPLQEATHVTKNQEIDLVFLGKELKSGELMWQWNTVIRDGAGGKAPSIPIAQFRQSTFAGQFHSKDFLFRHSSQYRPRISTAAKPFFIS